MGPRVSGWQGTLPEEALASFTRHDIEVITSGLVPTYMADVGLPLPLLAVDGGLSRRGVCFLAVLKVMVVPAFFRSHLQVGFWPSGTRSKQPKVSKGQDRNVRRLSPRGTQELTCHGRKRVGGVAINSDVTIYKSWKLFPWQKSRAYRKTSNYPELQRVFHKQRLSQEGTIYTQGIVSECTLEENNLPSVFSFIQEPLVIAGSGAMEMVARYSAHKSSTVDKGKVRRHSLCHQYKGRSLEGKQYIITTRRVSHGNSVDGTHQEDKEMSLAQLA